MQHDSIMQNIGVDVVKLHDLIQSVATTFKITEAQATVVVGTFMSETGDMTYDLEPIAKYISSLKLRSIESFNEAEIRLLLELKMVKRKQYPFKALANKIGRNDTCPCGSKNRYKNCCLTNVKAQDLERYFEQNVSI